MNKRYGKQKKYIVNTLGLNLRSKPEINASNIIVLLPQGQVVIKEAAVKGGEWWAISTTYRSKELSGYVGSAFLKAQKKGPEKARGGKGICPVHLSIRKNVSRNLDGMRAFPLSEKNMPKRKGRSIKVKVKALANIIEWLNVEDSARYRKKKGATYCNIYAYDFCYLSGPFLPRVWWMEKALMELREGKQVSVKYGETVREMNANSLYLWLKDFGEDFGWTRVFDLTELQMAANEGQVCIISASNKEANRSGHICAVVPETEIHKAVWKNGKVVKVLQSEAGGMNKKYTNKNLWWTWKEFGSLFGFWIHP